MTEWLPSLAAVAFAALAPHGAQAGDVSPAPGAYVVTVQDEVAGFDPDGGAHEDAGGDAGSEPSLPSCASVPDVDCIPSTSCVSHAESPTGFALQTIFPFANGATEFSIGSPCEPSSAERESLPALVLRAFERVPLPEPRLSIQPPKGRTLVGLETIFSTQAEPFTRTLTLLGRRVELRISPSTFTWLHDDTTTQTTDWPGKPWDSDQPDIDGYVTHLYEHTGTVRPGVEVTWSAQYRVGNGPWQDVNGTVTRTSPRADLQVLEGEPVLHGY